jgi:D-alanyl-D-alanine carboxypeptidase/D-alanyl-D-alanine-endopeptidase (penicillin-binding protein 4)
MFYPKNLIISFLSCCLFSLNNSLFFSVKAQEISPFSRKEICSQDFPENIDTLLHKPARLREKWGIVVKKLDNGKILYHLNSNQYFIPASNTKLFTTASILFQLDHNFQIKTPIYLQEEKPNKFKLIIEGKGDPSLSKSKLATIVHELKKKNIHQIHELILVDHYLPEPPLNYSWEFSDLYYYYAVPVNSLILEDNTVKLTLKPSQINDSVFIEWSDELAGKQWQIDNQGKTAIADSEYNISLNPSFLDRKLTIKGTLASNAEPDHWLLSIPQPTDYFRDVLIEQFTQNNIIISTTKLISYNDYQFSLLFKNKELLLEFNSPNLQELINITNQNSDNLYAEVLFKYLALNNNSIKSGKSLTEILNNRGISPDSYQFKDGSGLSRQNLVTPTALITLLEVMNDSQYAEIFRNSLAIAGVNGSLKNRFKDTKIANNLYAKTGTLSGVSALSGYLLRDNYDDLVFTIIVNNSTDSSASLRKVMDEIILMLGDLKECQ